MHASRLIIAMLYLTSGNIVLVFCMDMELFFSALLQKLANDLFQDIFTKM